MHLFRKGEGFPFSFLFFSFPFLSFQLHGQVQCDPIDHVSFSALGNSNNNSCLEEVFDFYFRNTDPQGTPGNDFDAYQVDITLEIVGDAIFDQGATEIFDNTFGVSYPSEKTLFLSTQCPWNLQEIMFGFPNSPVVRAVVIPGIQSTSYIIQPTVTAWVEGCSGTVCPIASNSPGGTPPAVQACASGLELVITFDENLPTNGTYIVDPHEEVVARLVLKNNTGAVLNLEDLDLMLRLEDIEGNLPIPTALSDLEEYFVETTIPAGEPQFETHDGVNHYFRFGSVDDGAGVPDGDEIVLLAFDVPPPEDLSNLQGSADIGLEYLRLLDSNGNCCMISGQMATVEFPGAPSCPPAEAVVFELSENTNTVDCESGFNLEVDLASLPGSPTSVSLDELHLEITTVSTGNLDYESHSGPNDPAVTVNPVPFSCPGPCTKNVISIAYSNFGQGPLLLDDGDTWSFSFRGSDMTLLEDVDVVSAVVKFSGSNTECVPSFDYAGLPLPIINKCNYCLLGYTLEIGPYGGTSNLGNCEEGFSVYLNVPDIATNVEGFRIGLDFENPNGLDVDAFSAALGATLCNQSTCPPTSPNGGNCLYYDNTRVEYSFCLPNGFNLPAGSNRMFDVIVSNKDGCLADFLFDMETVVTPFGGAACMPETLPSSLTEICTDDCLPNEFSFGGAIRNEENMGMQVLINTEGNGIFVTSNSSACPDDVTQAMCDDGEYTIDIQCDNPPEGLGYTIRPVKDKGVNPLNGVTTFDLVLITKHILGSQPLDSPYKLIAADANNSKSITTFDILTIRKLILFIDLEFQNNTSWRFIPVDYTFPDPTDPWAEIFPESINLNIVPGQSEFEGLDFIAVKVGDVNNSANCDNDFTSTQVDERSPGAYLNVRQAGTTKAGEQVELSFGMESGTDLSAWELGIRFLPEHLEYLGLEPNTELEGMHLGNFGLTEAEKGKVRALWYDPKGEAEKFTGELDFILSFRVVRPFRDLSEVLFLDNSVTPNRVFEADGTEYGIALKVVETPLADRQDDWLGDVFVEALPNPFGQRLQFVIQANQTNAFNLEVYDVHGRLLANKKGETEAGQVTVGFDNTADWAPGVVLWKLTVGDQTQTGRILKE